MYIGVRVDRSGGAVDVFAPLIISDAGAVNTFVKLLPPHVAKKSSTLSSHTYVFNNITELMYCL